MEKNYKETIRPILDTYDDIREILRTEKIELPNIVVVGDQSSGKSSVLESITGIELPRGENTVTKCPIVLQMRSVLKKEDECASIKIGNEPKELKCSISALKKSISDSQEELLKISQGEITDLPLYVYVKKIGAPDLTLYDLPGITYKNEKLTSKIKDIIAKYTAGKDTLILMVIPTD